MPHPNDEIEKYKKRSKHTRYITIAAAIITIILIVILAWMLFA